MVSEKERRGDNERCAVGGREERGEGQIEGVGGKRGLDVKSMGLDNFFGSESSVCVTHVYETRLP